MKISRKAAKTAKNNKINLNLTKLICPWRLSVLA